MSNRPLHVIFAGGGTGGHIFPGLAIAQELLAMQPGTTCSWLVSTRPLDTRILQAATVGGEPVRFETILAQPLSLRPRGLWRFVSKWGGSVRASRAAIRTIRASGAQVGAKGSVVVAAMGGFVAAPAAVAARAEKAPVLLVNLDGVPGQANRMIARYATRIVSAAPLDASRFAKWEVLPPIVRQGARSMLSAQDARRWLGLDADRPTLLITGGSQGAGSINEWMLALLASQAGRSALRGWQALHQTGPEKDAGSVGIANVGDQLRAAYTAANVQAVVAPFVDAMGIWWACATLAICRSGAGNVAEVWANRVPAIFLPYPFHKDQHQRINARQLEACGGAVVCTDHVARAANMRLVSPVLSNLLSDPTKIATMRAQLLQLPEADGARLAAQALLAMANI